MGIHISKKMSDIFADGQPLSVTVDLRKLGPRQRATLARYVKTGHVKGYSVIVPIAKKMRKDLGLPVIRVYGYYQSRVHVINQTQQISSAMQAALTHAKLVGAGYFKSVQSKNEWQANYAKRAISDDTNNLSVLGGSVTYVCLDKEQTDNIKKIKLERSKEAYKLARGIKDGTVTTYIIDLEGMY